MQSAAVPKNAVKNTGFNTATLMDCMAAMPSAGASRPSAAMTKAEKAKNSPPMSPAPKLATNVSA